MELCREILRHFDFAAIVETGTYRGLTTAYLRRRSNLPVYTVEACPRAFHFAKCRLAGEKAIHAELGDSRLFLQRLGQDPRFPHGCVYFYLDAHGKNDLPLSEEFQLVAKYWSNPVIMIDDFQVPGDSGYIFDDYGMDKRLTADYLPARLKSEFRLFWPAVRSEHETGSRRGCVVAGRRELAARKLAELALLQETICCG